MLNGKVQIVVAPSFLWQEEKYFSNQDESVELATDDSQLKKETRSFAAVVRQEDIIWYLEEKLSRKNYPRKIGHNSKESLYCYFATEGNCFDTSAVSKV